MTTRPASVLGLGTAVPAHRAGQSAYADFICQTLELDATESRLVRLLAERSGIDQRHAAILDSPSTAETLTQSFYPRISAGEWPGTASRMRAYALHAPPLAASAARAALTDARIGPHAITHLVTLSCTGFAAPGVDIALLTDLGLNPTVARVHIGFMGCHAAINALRVAQALVASDPSHVVLLVGVELCSLHLINSRRKDQLVASCLFADGAAAAILGHAPTATTSPPRTHPRLTLVDTSSVLLPGSHNAMGWTIGDAGFEMTLAESVPTHIARHALPWVQALTDRFGLTLESARAAGQWCVHPGGPRILNAVADSLSLPSHALDASRAVLASHGNMSSVTTLFILNELRCAHAIQPHSPGTQKPAGEPDPIPIVALAFGPGLAGEAALFHLHPTST